MKFSGHVQKVLMQETLSQISDLSLSSNFMTKKGKI